MQILADENMPLVQQFFAELGDVHLFNGRTVTAEQLKDADILLVRSVTNVDAALLAMNSRLRFVGTATIGIDHIDQQYLAQRNIPFVSAPGCNAQSVTEYVLSSLWCLAEKYQWDLTDKTVGIVIAMANTPRSSAPKNLASNNVETIPSKTLPPWPRNILNKFLLKDII